MSHCFTVTTFCAFCIDASWINAFWECPRLKMQGGLGREGRKPAPPAAKSVWLNVYITATECLHSDIVVPVAHSSFLPHQSAAQHVHHRCHLPPSPKRQGIPGKWALNKLWGWMGIVLAGQVWPRGAPVPDSALSSVNASLFILITIQVSKTLGDFKLREGYLASG